MNIGEDDCKVIGRNQTLFESHLVLIQVYIQNEIFNYRK